MGCSDWLDVRPKSQVKEDDLFTSGVGIPGHALIGIYALDGTYGYLWRELHDGILGPSYADLTNRSCTDYNKALVYDYQDETIKSGGHTLEF